MPKVSKKILKKNLTPKEKHFTNKIIEQISQGKNINATEAVLESYDTKNKKSASVMGTKLLDDNRITNEIEKVLARQGITADEVSSNIKEIANAQPKYISGDVKLRANELLLKLLGHANKNVSISVKADLGKLSYEEVKAKLSEVDVELKQIMEGEIVS